MGQISEGGRRQGGITRTCPARWCQIEYLASIPKRSDVMHQQRAVPEPLLTVVMLQSTPSC